MSQEVLPMKLLTALNAPGTCPGKRALNDPEHLIAGAGLSLFADHP
jgi:hypothetical protein